MLYYTLKYIIYVSYKGVDMNYIFLTGLFITSFSASATIYKCNINDVVIFSQFPCATNSEEIEIKTISTSSSKNNLQTHDVSSEIDNFIQLRDIESKITKSNNLVRTYQNTMIKKISLLGEQLDKKPQKMTIELSEVAHNSAIATQIDNHIKRYNSLIRIEQQKITRLIVNKQHINQSIKKLEIAKPTDTNDSIETEKFIQNSKIEANIKINENKITTYQNKMNSELDELDFSSVSSIKQNISTVKMSIITAKYNTKINVLQKQIEHLLDNKIY